MNKATSMLVLFAIGGIVLLKAFANRAQSGIIPQASGANTPLSSDPYSDSTIIGDVTGSPDVYGIGGNCFGPF